MFVEISGDFLVFFLQEKKGKEAKFLYRMSSGCSAITLTCARALFSPSLSRNRQCFPFQLPLTVAERVPVGSVVGAFYWCGTWWVGWLSQISQLAWMVGGIMDVSKSSTNIFLYKWTERREHAVLVKRLMIKRVSICQGRGASNLRKS